ncbi:MAG TPA: DUF4337 domain-containing protein [Polyangia bacterium]|jgi:hypothetical protein|nr:DUF4337 domain-containing protein [Polyangia bacterium]
MTELADTVNEAVERSRDEDEEGEGQAGEGDGEGGGKRTSGPGGRRGRWTLNAVVAISVAITATFTALCNVKKGNVVEAMARAQASGIDTWAYYQAKGTKLNIAESALDSLRTGRESTPGLTSEGRAFIDRKLGEYADKIRRYEVEKEEIKRKAEGFHEHYEVLDARHDQFDMAEALTSIAIALLGLTALTQKRPLLYLAWTFATLGIVLGLAGFIGLGLHPDFLARALGSS